MTLCIYVIQTKHVQYEYMTKTIQSEEVSVAIKVLKQGR